jgi:hypothetical protein
VALASVALLGFARPSAAAVAGFNTSAGYDADDLAITADTFAVAPDGRFAVGTGSTVTVYNHADPAGRAALATITSPKFKTLGGLAFQGADTLLVTDNTFLSGAILSAAISSGTVSTLAAPGTANDVAQVRVRPTDGSAFAVLSHNPGQGAVVEVTGSGVSPFAGGLGTGYLGGLAFDAAGNVYVGDTNDPNFMGAAGKVLELSGAGALLGSASLAGGGGHGVYDVNGFNGDYYATTGNTLTRLNGGVATQVGAFTGAYPFPTDVAIDSTGVLVNGNYTGVGGVFRVRPAGSVPEPASLALLAIGMLPFLRTRRR